MTAEPLSLETVFNKVLAAVEDLLTKQSTCPYQTDRLSEYDVVVHLSAEDNDYFLAPCIRRTASRPFEDSTRRSIYASTGVDLGRRS